MGIDWKLQEEMALKALSNASPAAKVYTYDSQGGADFNDLNKAIASCVADRGDLILVAPGSHNQSAIVNINIRGIRIFAANMGMPPEFAGERFMIRPASTYVTGPPVKITQPCHLRGLGFTTRYIAAGEPLSCGLLFDCEETGGWNAGFTFLENCRFPVWYGAQAYGVYAIGGSVVKIQGCTFDGLFSGFATAGIGMAGDTGGIDSCYWKIENNKFDGMGSAKPAVKFITGNVPRSFLLKGNVNNSGYGSAARGVLLDNNSRAAEGLVCDNWTGLANKAAAFTNLTNTVLSFQDNHYNET